MENNSDNKTETTYQESPKKNLKKGNPQIRVHLGTERDVKILNRASLERLAGKFDIETKEDRILRYIDEGIANEKPLVKRGK